MARPQAAARLRLHLLRLWYGLRKSARRLMVLVDKLRFAESIIVQTLCVLFLNIALGTFVRKGGAPSVAMEVLRDDGGFVMSQVHLPSMILVLALALVILEASTLAYAPRS